MADNRLNRWIASLDHPEQGEKARQELIAHADALIQLLADGDDTRRRAAEDALIKLGPDVVISLIDTLDLEDSTLRGAAADLLGAIKDERALDALQEVSRIDSSRWVRSRAEKALSQFPSGSTAATQETPALTPPSDTLQQVRAQAAEWPSLRDKTAPPENADDAMTAEQIRALLEQLDARLAKGKISEAAHQELYARWATRLRELDQSAKP